MAFQKRKIYLINRPFQIKFSLLISIIVVLISLVFPIAVYDIMNSFIDFAHNHNPSAVTSITAQKKEILLNIIFSQAVIAAVFFLVSIFFSHKIAGPLYKLSMHLEKIRSHNRPGKLFFRKGDYFQDLAEDINKTFSSLSEEVDKQKSELEELSSKVSPEHQENILKVSQELDKIKNNLSIS